MGSREPVSADITLNLDRADDAALLERVLVPELGDEVPGTRTRLERDGATLRLDVDAEDVPALRAAVNAYLQWSETGLDVAGLTTDSP
jgi:tRNA threonylcarbamoyladenosine modification (KEOPS) complex  Pcc1 subunit